jgi:phosphoserine phosphatase
VDEMRAALRESRAWTPGIRDAVERLHETGARVCVTTDQPDFLAEATRELFGVDDLACTRADVAHGRVAGSYQYEGDKWANLARLLRARRIDPSEVAHVGNGANDVPVFQRVGDSVAVWPMGDAVRRGAKRVIERPGDLGEIVDELLH